MIQTKVAALFIQDISQKIWQNVFSLCFGEEKMYMQKEVRMEVTFLNVPIDGMIIYALNNKIRKYSVMNVSIKNGRD
jgi:hypothetical protein